jgi:IMP dehydrogenase
MNRKKNQKPKKILKPELLISKTLKSKNLPENIALTFSDVTIQSEWSKIKHRSDLNNFKSYLSKDFFLNIPIVSANMGDVTNYKTAIAMAREGGLGFIPQFTSLEDRINQIKKVKRADNVLIEDPIVAGPDITLGEAKRIMSQNHITGILIVDKDNKLLGILSHKDYRFEKDDSVSISKIMTKNDLRTAYFKISREEAVEIFNKFKLEKLPLVDKDNTLKGLMTAKDIMKERLYPRAIKDSKGKLCVGAALRLSGDYMKEAKEFLSSGADVLLLDTARAGSEITLQATKDIKKQFPKCVLVVGNIDNPMHVIELGKAGADCIKVGIGPGSRCKTRMVAGVGTPQITAVLKCFAVAKEMGIKIISDGGIKDSSDMAKILASGADSVMIGSLFAGTDEAPGILIRKGNQLWKRYRGSASLDHQIERIENGSLDVVRNPEGESADVAYSGSVSYVIENLIDGLKSSMSYVGATDLEIFKERTKFIWISNSGFEEGKPRI